MAKRQAAETLGDLLRSVIEDRRFSAWCTEAGLRPQTVAKLIDGLVVKPQRATVLALAKGLGIDADRVRAACDASRAAAGK